MITRHLEFRAEVQGNKLSGYAAVHGSFAKIGNNLETIAPGAFDRAIREKQDVRLTVGHDRNVALARTKSGTLKLSADKTGLYFEADLPDTQLARDLITSVSRGDLDSMSFAYSPTSEGWEQRDGKQVNVIKDLDLFDVSVVGMPAYQGTSVQLRSFDFYNVPTSLPVKLIAAKSRLTLLENK